MLGDMNITRKIAITITAMLLIGICILAYAIYDDKINNRCGLSEERAKKHVLAMLRQRKLPEKYLQGPIDQRGSCRYGYPYRGHGENLYFVVESTWTEGIKTIYFDYIRQNQE